MPYFLALDAGGTKTDYLLADQTRVLARVRTGTIKRMRVDAPTATAHLASALEQLTARSGVSMGEIAHTCVGTAGNTIPLVTGFLRAELGARVSGGLLVLGDVEIALDAAFPGLPGILVLAGTGSNVAGRGTDGVVRTAGGWGPALADQGSGYRIGHLALRGVCLAHDEERSTALFAEMLTHWQLSSFEDLVDFANRSPAPDFSQLTHLVVRCAEAGDWLAQEVLAGAGEELAYLVCALARRLRSASADAGFTPQLAFTGSILERIPAVREALLRSVQREFPTVEGVPGVVDPVVGALWRARSAYAGG